MPTTGFALIDQLQNRSDGEGLGDAADPVVEVRLHRRAGGLVRHPERLDVLAVRPPDPDDGTGNRGRLHRAIDGGVQPTRDGLIKLRGDCRSRRGRRRAAPRGRDHQRYRCDHEKSTAPAYYPLPTLVAPSLVNTAPTQKLPPRLDLEPTLLNHHGARKSPLQEFLHNR